MIVTTKTQIKYGQEIIPAGKTIEIKDEELSGMKSLVEPVKEAVKPVKQKTKSTK